MKRLFLSATILLGAVVTAPAFAQNLWDGPEIGIQGGYAWGTSSGNFQNLTGPITTPVPYSFSTDGGLGGGHIGYNFQFDRVVLGIEGDVEGGYVSGSTTNTAAAFTVKSTMDFDASIRGKLGWALGRWLPYATGGVAFGDVKTSYAADARVFPAIAPVGSTDGVRVGWTAGGGLAYAVTANWEIGAEYRYTDLGHKSFDPPVITDNNEFNFSAVRLNITYRFAPPPPPPPMAPMPAAAPAPPPPPMARTFLVFFDFDRYNLTPDARRVIEAAAEVYKAGGHPRIDVSGYTDLAGTQAYNLRLSQRRADAVAGYLMKQGVPKNVMDVKWFGKEHPRVPTADGIREPQNRRVEIVMP